MSTLATCPLCQQGATTSNLVTSNIASSPQWRIIWADDPNYPCFVRVVWAAHVAEMTDLSAAAQTELMRVVFAVESAMRAVLKPQKINLASFGNYVPHVHWHIIPRFADDAHWPEPTWAASQRNGAAHGEALKTELAQAIQGRLV